MLATGSWSAEDCVLVFLFPLFCGLCEIWFALSWFHDMVEPWVEMLFRWLLGSGLWPEPLPEPVDPVPREEVPFV